MNLSAKTSPLAAVAVFCLAAALASPIRAQTTLVEPAAPLLPQHFGTWQLKNQAPPTTGSDPSQADAAHAAELREDGLSRFSTAAYTRGSATLTIQALQFGDATGAAAALNLYEAVNPSLHPTPRKLGIDAVSGPSDVLFRSGNTVILARSSSAQTAISLNDLEPLAVTLPKIGGPKGLSPWLPTLLPVKDLTPGSVRYTLGPASYASTGGRLPAEILGFTKAAETVSGLYNDRSGKGVVTLLLYPTPQIAGDRGRAIEGWLNGGARGLGTVKLRREGPLVLMVAGTFPAEEAQRRIENIHLHSEVTWEKQMQPEFHAEVRKTYSLLMSITILAGVLMLAAILLGLFLGGGRAAIRVMRGKSAATEPEFLGLGLDRGPSKALDGHDQHVPG